MRPGPIDAAAEQRLKLVHDGISPAGHALPGESELATRFGASRLTMREAMQSPVSTRVTHG